MIPYTLYVSTFQIVDDQLKTKIFLNHEIKLRSITTQDNGGNT